VKYIALLRGINVGGNSIIKMKDLKETVEKCDFRNVRTYIQSGNIVFESDNEDAGQIEAELEKCLMRSFESDLKVILRTGEQLAKVVSGVPAEWNKNNDLRCYIAFVKAPVTAGDVAQEVEPKQGVDFVAAGEGVVYMSTLLSGLTKSGFTRLIAKKVYKDVTMRNYTTVRKLLALLEPGQDE
jgi:uncharacterized protein (DUF1697 family)